MIRIVVVTRAALWIARRASTWTVDEHLGGRSPDCVAVDPRDPTRVERDLVIGKGAAGDRSGERRNSPASEARPDRPS